MSDSEKDGIVDIENDPSGELDTFASLSFAIDLASARMVLNGGMADFLLDLEDLGDFCLRFDHAPAYVEGVYRGRVAIRDGNMLRHFDVVRCVEGSAERDWIIPPYIELYGHLNNEAEGKHVRIVYKGKRRLRNGYVYKQFFVYFNEWPEPQE